MLTLSLFGAVLVHACISSEESEPLVFPVHVDVPKLDLSTIAAAFLIPPKIIYVITDPVQNLSYFISG